MRKTLTLVLLVLAASPLAACKMFWEHDEKPAAAASTTDPAQTEPGNTDPTQTAQTAQTATPATPASPDQPAPAVPAKK